MNAECFRINPGWRGNDDAGHDFHGDDFDHRGVDERGDGNDADEGGVVVMMFMMIAITIISRAVTMVMTVIRSTGQ